MYSNSCPKRSHFSLSAFNSYLLTTIVKDFRLGSDPRSLVRRHQTLSIIYANISLTLMIVLYEAASLLMGMYYHLSPPVMIMPCIFSSFICLRMGKNDMAAVFLLIYAQGINFFVSHYRHSSVGAVACIFMFPNFSFFITSSITVQVINACISLAQTLFHFTSIWKAFSVTLTQEQSDEISHLMTSSFPCLALLCMMLIAQKRVENLIWQTAHRTHEKMEEINLEIMQAVESKDSFISSLSHEIRNPLNAMNGSIAYLLSVVRDAQSQRILTNAKISGETLLNLFNNLLDAAKMKSEKMELSYSEMNLRETFKKTLIINCENINAKKIFVDVLINKNLPQIIRSDSARLLQILMNLLSNAIKFTAEGGKIIISATFCPKDTPKEILTSQMIPQGTLEELTHRNPRTSPKKVESVTDEFTHEEAEFRFRNLKSIRMFESKALEWVNLNQSEIVDKKQPWSIREVNMSAEDQKNSVLPGNSSVELDNYFLKVQITDTGCGIAEENIPKLFEMFTQAHRSVTSSHGGTGLGLWICKQLCQKMGGEIKLYSKLSVGTTFVFYLPISAREEIDSEHFEIDTWRRHSEKISCLVVDDYNYNRELYKLLLEREGIQVIVASNGEEAINKYQGNQGKFDLILMDVQMPKVDGFTAARKIRAIELENQWRRSDIYFISGEYFDEKELMASFKIHGGNNQTLGIKSLKKPIDMDVIARLTAKYTRKGR